MASHVNYFQLQDLKTVYRSRWDFFEITRIIDTKRARIVFLENVPNLKEPDDAYKQLGKPFFVCDKNYNANKRGANGGIKKWHK